MPARMLFAVVLLFTSAPALAQQVRVEAIVPVASPTGGGTRDLTFGMLTPIAGTTQNIDVVAAAAPVSATVQSGEFRYNVAGARGLEFNVSVPAQLTAPGYDPLAVSANGSQYGGYCVSTSATCSMTSFNPASGQNIRVCRVNLPTMCNPIVAFPGGSVMRVYVGGRLTVPPTARAGVYTGTVTLTIVQVY